MRGGPLPEADHAGDAPHPRLSQRLWVRTRPNPPGYGRSTVRAARRPSPPRSPGRLRHERRYELRFPPEPDRACDAPHPRLAWRLCIREPAELARLRLVNKAAKRRSLGRERDGRWNE